MLFKAILIALWGGLCGIDQFDFTETIHRPIICGLVIGLILGDVKQGLIIGGALELVWMGLVPLAGAQPPNIVVGGVLGVSLGILGGFDVETVVGLIFPFAVLAQMMVTLMFTIFSPLMHTADRYAKETNTTGIDMINYSQLALRFIIWGLISFVVVYFGAESARSFVNAMPQKLIEGFKVAGGMMPAIGFALLLNIMLKKEYVPFLIFGFILAAYMKLPILAIALIGISIALYDFYLQGNLSSKKVEEDYDDGI